MTTVAMRKKLTDYVQTAPDKKVRAIYALVEEDAATEVNEPEEEFFKELDRRSKSFDDAAIRTYTWEETKQAAIDSLKAKRK